MRLDDTDTSVLAQQLWVGPRELLESVGGPWYVAFRDAVEERGQQGTLFVGRAGPSVAIFVDDAVPPTVIVGAAKGDWLDPGTLRWSLNDPVTTLPVPGPQAPASVDEFLKDLRVAVEAAADAKAPSLVTCRYCGDLVAPEHALGDDSCQSCGSIVFGIVY